MLHWVIKMVQHLRTRLCQCRNVNRSKKENKTFTNKSSDNDMSVQQAKHRKTSAVAIIRPPYHPVATQPSQTHPCSQSRVKKQININDFP